MVGDAHRRRRSTARAAPRRSRPRAAELAQRLHAAEQALGRPRGEPYAVPGHAQRVSLALESGRALERQLDQWMARTRASAHQRRPVARRATQQRAQPAGDRKRLAGAVLNRDSRVGCEHEAAMPLACSEAGLGITATAAWAGAAATGTPTTSAIPTRRAIADTASPRASPLIAPGRYHPGLGPCVPAAGQPLPKPNVPFPRMTRARATFQSFGNRQPPISGIPVQPVNLRTLISTRCPWRFPRHRFHLASE